MITDVALNCTKTNSQWFRIWNVYAPPVAQSRVSFYEKLGHHFLQERAEAFMDFPTPGKALMNNRSFCILGGDLNEAFSHVDKFSSAGNHTLHGSAAEFARGAGYTDAYRLVNDCDVRNAYTHIRQTHAGVCLQNIDHILIDNAGFVLNSWIQMKNGPPSDHNPLFVTLNLTSIHVQLPKAKFVYAPGGCKWTPLILRGLPGSTT